MEKHLWYSWEKKKKESIFVSSPMTSIKMHGKKNPQHSDYCLAIPQPHLKLWTAHSSISVQFLLTY